MTFSGGRCCFGTGGLGETLPKDFRGFAKGLAKRFCQQAEPTVADVGRKER